MAAAVRAGDTGQFGWFLKLGATPEAVAVLNDEPIIFVILLVVIHVLIGQGLIQLWIQKATWKPEQQKAKDAAKAKKAAGKGGKR